jgi:hypothetical protein
MSYLLEGSCLVCRRAHVLFVGELMSYLRCLCLFTYGGVQCMLRCVFVLSVSLDYPFLIAPSEFSGMYFLTNLISICHKHLKKLMAFLGDQK